MPPSHARADVADPSGLDDLEAELRRMEEELAALKGKKPDKKKAKTPPPTEVPTSAAPASATAEAPKKRFGLPRFGKKDEAPVPPPMEATVDALPVAPVEAAPPAADDAHATTEAPAAAIPTPTLITSTPSGRWRREGTAWVLQNPPREPVHLRRVLDAVGRVLREEPAPPELFAPPRPPPVEEAGEPPAEAAPEAPLYPEAEKPLHTLAERLGGKKKKGLFGRRKGD